MNNIAKKIALLSVLGLTIGTSAITVQAQEKNSNYDSEKRIAALVASVAIGAALGKIAFNVDPAHGVNLASWFALWLVRRIAVGELSNIIWNQQQANEERETMNSAASFAGWTTYGVLMAQTAGLL